MRVQCLILRNVDTFARNVIMNIWPRLRLAWTRVSPGPGAAGAQPLGGGGGPPRPPQPGHQLRHGAAGRSWRGPAGHRAQLHQLLPGGGRPTGAGGDRQGQGEDTRGRLSYI